MPLASSLTSAQKRAEVVEMERRQHERRSAVVAGRRMSLPSTIQSTTVATKSKVDRRRSIRRESSSGSVNSLPPAKAQAKENKAPHYSPPETRSAKKMKALNPAFFDKAATTAILQFSPPNQAVNERNERERMQRQEEERARRIEKARRNGQLIVLSPSNRAHQFRLDLSPSNVATSSVASSASNLTEEQTNKQEELLKKMSEEMALLAKNQAEANSTRRTSDVDLLKKVQEMITAESQAMLHSTLEQTNEMLLADLKELNTKFASEKESYSVNATRLEMQLHQSQQKVATLEQLHADLELQNANMQEDKTALTSTVTALEGDLKVAKDQLQHDRAMLLQLQQQSASEQHALAQEVRQFKVTNEDLKAQLEEVLQSNEALEGTVASYEQIIQRLERDVIPNLEAALEMERDTVARMEADLETRLSELGDSMAATEALKQQLEQMQQKNEEERNCFQMLNEDSHKAFQKMTAAADEKDRQIAALTQQLQSRQQAMTADLQRMFESNASLQKAQDTLIAEQKQVNDALEESMVQLDHAVKEKKELEAKLAKALKKLETAYATIKSKNSETASCVEGLADQVAGERKRREDAEERRKEAELLARENDQKVNGLEKKLKQTIEERDTARNNMQGFNEREEDLYRKLQESDRIRREMHSRIMQLMGNIRVFVRVRPPLPGEIEKEQRRIASGISDDCKKRKREADEDEVTPFRFPGVYDDRGDIERQATTSGNDLTKHLIEVQEPYKDRGGLQDRRKKWRFGFDSVFSPAQGQEEVWEATEPLIQCAVDGFNVTVFAYGQTGSGKTYTMLGEDGNDGLIGRSVRKLFDEKREMESLSRGETCVSISVELLEVYNEKIRDLLSPKKDQDLKVMLDEVVGNMVVQTNSVQEVMKVMTIAQGRRCVKATGSNSESSRSHMIFTLHFKVTMKDGVERNGKLNICDLAGSERLNKSGANNSGGALLEESKNINMSLSVLSNVIERLQAGDTIIPFRESKLTFLLKNSLSGNSKTLAIVCCNPLATHFNESICSLRFAEKVNRVDLKAVANFSC